MWAYFQRFGTHRVSRYLNIDQAPIIHNQPDWQGGLFGTRQAELFAQFESLITKSTPYMLHIHDFRHLPYTIKTDLLKIEQAFSLLSVGRAHSQLLAKTLSHRTPHQISLMDHATWQHKLHCLAAYIQLPYDYRNALEVVDIPTTLLIGGRSQLYDPVWQQRLSNMLPNATTEILPKSGHAVPMDVPVRFYQALKRFLQG
jgi:pimeloyl-ACP methyl ester carboxylesterase